MTQNLNRISVLQFKQKLDMMSDTNLALTERQPFGNCWIDNVSYEGQNSEHLTAGIYNNFMLDLVPCGLSSHLVGSNVRDYEAFLQHDVGLMLDTL